MIRRFQLIFAICLLIGWTFSIIYAQQSEPSDSPVATTTRPITEIVVNNQNSLPLLRLRIKGKEEEIFSFFNANNSSDRMDINCYQRKPIGSHITKRVCEPRFLTKLRQEKTRDARSGFGVGFNERDLVGLAEQDFNQLQNEMFSLRAEYKGFSDMLDALADLVAGIDAQKKMVFNDN